MPGCSSVLDGACADGVQTVTASWEPVGEALCRAPVRVRSSTCHPTVAGLCLGHYSGHCRITDNDIGTVTVKGHAGSSAE